MKVLISSYNLSFQNKSGGIQTRIRQTIEHLRSHGVDVDVFSPFTTKLCDYDVLHVFGLSFESWSLIKYAKNLGLKIVLSSIVPLEGKAKLTLYKLLLPLKVSTSFRFAYEIMQLVDCVIAESFQEADFVSNLYDVSRSRIRVIPNGYTPIKSAGKQIFNLIGKECTYVLQVGRFDNNKNQINVIKAVKNTDINVVFVGGNAQHDTTDYLGLMKKEAKGYPNIFFTDWLPSDSDELASAFQNASVFILPSYKETFGLVAVEAASTGCHVCLSKTLPILDFEVFDRELSFDPSSPKDIKRVLIAAVNKPRNSIVNKSVEETFSWDSIVQQIISCYEK